LELSFVLVISVPLEVDTTRIKDSNLANFLRLCICNSVLRLPSSTITQQTDLIFFGDSFLVVSIINMTITPINDNPERTDKMIIAFFVLFARFTSSTLLDISDLFVFKSIIWCALIEINKLLNLL
jgi:hypothetical protein